MPVNDKDFFKQLYGLLKSLLAITSTVTPVILTLGKDNAECTHKHTQHHSATVCIEMPQYLILM